MSTKRRIVVFTALSFVLSWGIVGFSVISGRPFGVWFYLAFIAVPAFVSLIIRLLFERKDFRDMGLLISYKPYEILMFGLLPLAIVLIDSSLFSPIGDFIKFWLVFGFAASVFEEIAFRGWLAPRLSEVLNYRSFGTAMTGGFIWALWLLPLCFFYRGNYFVGNASDPFGYFLVFLSLFGFVLTASLCGATLLYWRLYFGGILPVIIIRSLLSSLIFISTIAVLAAGAVMALFSYRFFNRFDNARQMAPEFLESDETLFSRPDILRKLMLGNNRKK